MLTLGKLGIGLGFANQGGGGLITCSGAGQSFNGIDEYAYVADNGALDIKTAVDAGATDFCMSCKIKTSDNITSAQEIIGKDTTSNVVGRYSFYIYNTILFCFVKTSDGVVGGGNGITDNITLAINTEYHILCRIDITNSKVYFYIDGVLQNTGGTSYTGTFATMANAYEFNIAVANGVGGASNISYLKGTVKDARIYHKNVVPDLTALMAGEKLGDEVAWWCLPTLADISANSYDLTGVNL